jgi:hypothetical protein
MLKPNPLNLYGGGSTTNKAPNVDPYGAGSGSKKAPNVDPYGVGSATNKAPNVQPYGGGPVSKAPMTKRNNLSLYNGANVRAPQGMIEKGKNYSAFDKTGRQYGSGVGQKEKSPQYYVQSEGNFLGRTTRIYDTKTRKLTTYNKGLFDEYPQFTVKDNVDWKANPKDKGVYTLNFKG